MFNHTNFTTNPVCQEGHEWKRSINFHSNLEGLACDCGTVIFHTEKCKCCNQNVQKHRPNVNFKKTGE